MSGIFFASIGGNLMNFDRPDWPGTEIATRVPLSLLRLTNSAKAARTNSTGSASGCVSSIGYSM